MFYECQQPSPPEQAKPPQGFPHPWIRIVWISDCPTWGDWTRRHWSKASTCQLDSHDVWTRRGSDSSKGRLGNQARKNLSEPKTLHARPTSTCSGTVQRAGYSIYLGPHLGRLSDKVRPAPHNTDSKNLLKPRPPQR
jgi:hypothetical protein